MVSTQHIVTAYDDELAALDRMIAAMGGQVEQQLSDSVSGLVRADLDMAEKVVRADKAIDQLELDINQQVTQLLALRQPMAADLRAVVASLKIANDLERMGDYSKNIAKRLGVCQKTVDNYRAIVLDKMGVENVAQLALLMTSVSDAPLETQHERMR